MDFLTFLVIFNYNLVLVYGLFLSVDISGGWKNRQQKLVVFALCPLFMVIQGSFWIILGDSAARQLYPLIVHLPLVLILIFVLKKRTGIAFISVCTAYLFCQLPRWVGLVFAMVTDSPWVGQISYTLVVFPIYVILRRYFVGIAYDAITYSRQNLILFSGLPIVYYIFDYATVVYSDAMYAGIPVLMEFFPTVSIIFYVVFLSAYHVQVQKRTQAELQQSMIEAELKQSAVELENMRFSETQTAIYRHDMRHHLNMIDGFLTADKMEQAREYIKKVQEDVESVTVKRFCENEIVNLLCSSFSSKAQRMGIRLDVKTKLPETLPISETELCSVLSNGLENALHAVKILEEPYRSVELYCAVQRNKLLIEMKNHYSGEIILRDGIPVAGRDGHGYGCRSIQSITQLHNGICIFEAEKGVFTLRIVLPLKFEQAARRNRNFPPESLLE